MHPYNDFEGPDGWFNSNDVRVYKELLEKLPDGAEMVELGVAKGRSLCSVAEVLKRKNIQVQAVDTFEGTTNEGDAHADAKTTDWEKIFRDNLREHGINGQVSTRRGRTDSEEVLSFVADGSLDLVFVDADHSKEAVLKDIQLWKPKLKPTGILAGHDFEWESVRQGIEAAGLHVVSDGNMWFLLPVAGFTKPLWSICLISRNEAKHLPKALESLKEFRDRGGEVVVVDTGSTDGTAQIARDAGCVVEEVGTKYLHIVSKEEAEVVNARFIVGNEAPVLNEGETIFDFGSARNHCANLASNNMISMMDCDEVFSKLDIDKINSLIEQGFNQFEYSFVFAHDADGKPSIQFTQSKMYDKRHMFWDGIIHECLAGSGRRTFLDSDVLLLEHYQNVETNRTGYLRGLALDCFNRQDNDRQSHYFAREMMYTGRFRSAIKEFERHVAMKRWPAERAQSITYIGECYERLGFHELAVSAYQESFNIESGRREPLIRLAQHYFSKGDAQRTAAYASAALTIPHKAFYADNMAHYREWPHEMLYWALFWLGDREGAKIHHAKALEFCPTHPKYLSDTQFFYGK